ncbi:DNA translocase FtsK [Elstera cyanobacteriorum]|uniref:DNA translocase FtsK n=1 Tax=Elstera cyanobacteriorum TaxID=2022747 RepID=UPI0023521FDB|nr:DNA translocase FtsK [Elstera cyanobacteriorum]MCK6444011.1 DNA translocase FtsK [Elstera cyanobacteriorum]
MSLLTAPAPETVPMPEGDAIAEALPTSAAAFDAWVAAKGYRCRLSPHVSGEGKLEWALLPAEGGAPLLLTGETLEARAVAGALLFLRGLEEGISLGRAQAQAAYDADLADRDAACDALLGQVLRLETIVEESEASRIAARAEGERVRLDLESDLDQVREELDQLRRDRIAAEQSLAALTESRKGAEAALEALQDERAVAERLAAEARLAADSLRREVAQLREDLDRARREAAAAVALRAAADAAKPEPLAPPPAPEPVIADEPEDEPLTLATPAPLTEEEEFELLLAEEAAAEAAKAAASPGLPPLPQRPPSMAQILTETLNSPFASILPPSLTPSLAPVAALAAPMPFAAAKPHDSSLTVKAEDRDTPFLPPPPVTVDAEPVLAPDAETDLEADADEAESDLADAAETTPDAPAELPAIPLVHRAYTLPAAEMLTCPPADREQAVEDEVLDTNARQLESVLQDFNIKGEIVDVRPGPVVTLYEFEPAPGTKSSRIIGLAEDIARSMSAVAVRIAVVPGRTVIGIELPNPQREMVYLGEMLRSDAYTASEARLPLILGKDIGGTPVVADLAKMPHLLIAGTTGSGKSVGINTMILSLLYRHGPKDCRLIMVDPKMLELSVYADIPHLLTPVVTDPKKAAVALKWAVREMEDRYRAMAQLGVRNIEGYNARVAEMEVTGEKPTRRVAVGVDRATGQAIFEDHPIDLKHLPYIVIIVDEMADLMLVAGKEIEATIQRLAQMARAAGIHIVMATQRPSVDVITGTIKANFPTRISFQVTSKIDSRTILGDAGAEQLLGQGDMLHMAGGGRITRVHAPFVSDQEVEQVVQFLKSQGMPDYVEGVTTEEEEEDDRAGSLGLSGGSGDGPQDELYDQAVALVMRERKASTSFIQRYLQIGYNRAARLVERMEAEGVVGAPNHVGKREVLLTARREL